MVTSPVVWALFLALALVGTKPRAAPVTVAQGSGVSLSPAGRLVITDPIAWARFAERAAGEAIADGLVEPDAVLVSVMRRALPAAIWPPESEGAAARQWDRMVRAARESLGGTATPRLTVLPGGA